MNEELIAFAEEVRRRSIEILARALIEQERPVDPFDAQGDLDVTRIEPGSTAALAAALCDLAGDTMRQAQLLEEQAQGYDLASLAGSMTGHDDECPAPE